MCYTVSVENQMNSDLIKSGGGTGPVKPGNPSKPAVTDSLSKTKVLNPER